jgi:hypothetical protein
MTCTRYETDLALYVERDLPPAAAAAVEAHLGECPSCPRLLAELYASQALVKDLAAEEIDPEALATVRVRAIVAAARARRSRRSGTVPAWAMAAAIVLGLGAAAWSIRHLREADPARTAAVSLPPRVARPTVAPVTAPPSPRSTLPGSPAVSPRMEPSHVRHGRTGRRPAAVPTLSPDDADQLARAVVAIAGIRRVDDNRPELEPSPAPALMRLATADPDVVIYWQLEPNGGE